MKFKPASSVFLFLLLCTDISAQFSVGGTDPASVRWSEIEGSHYRVIYPRGMDSLGRVFAVELERYAPLVGKSAGMDPASGARNKLPVILHPYISQSNGVVTWTPRRMNLYTTPAWLGSSAYPWHSQLAVHEGRHAAQMQAGHDRRYLCFRILSGEIFEGLYASLYGGPFFLEGDAVATEYELCHSGRAQEADFLEYWRVCSSAGERRDLWQWVYGSQRRYSPDHYRPGFVLNAGMRSVFGVEDFTKRFYDRARDKFLPFFNLQKTVKETTGLKLRDAFSVICDSLDVFWEKDAAGRGPFVPFSTISPAPERYADYHGTALLGARPVSIRTSISRPTELVDPDGKSFGVFSSSVRRLRQAPDGRIYWTEIVPDRRWSLRSYSDIFFMGPDHKKGRLTRRTRFFSISPSPDGARICASALPPQGGSAVVILDVRTGKETGRIPAPDSLQIAEVEWLDSGNILASAICGKGIGLFDVTDNFREVLAPQQSSISELWHKSDTLFFTSDLSGVNELYALSGEKGQAFRLTSTRHGASSFAMNESGDTLYASIPGVDGRLVGSAAVRDLPAPAPADFSTPPPAPFRNGFPAEAAVPADNDSPEISEPKNYVKGAHLLHFHSWLPVCAAFDSESSISFETIMQQAGLGATAYFQNELGTAYGYVAYKASPGSPKWTHTGLASFTYTGLYPVFETKLSISSESSVSLKAYIPFNFSSGGWTRGLIPQITGTYALRFGTAAWGYSVNASLRGYTMLPAPSSCIYPKLGIGGQVGFAANRELQEIYSKIYGYLPGFHETHGISLSVFNEYLLNGNDLLSATLDYAIPFGSVDWGGMSPVAYVRNFELIPHAEMACGFMKGKDSSLAGGVGTVFDVVLGNLAFIPFTTRIGVSYTYLFGDVNRHHSVNLVFSIDL
ncbi:MAG: hypothetical protein MJY44_00300 [Bacteroidales bacterium]|nr:hypothetical protein [Bacteroidales bacterium]